MPPKFHFGLAPLLEHRRRIEKERERRFSRCRQELQALESNVPRVCDALPWYYDRWIAARRQQAAGLRVRLKELRDGFIAARRDRRVLERLYERRRDAYDAQLARYEEMEIDEANAALRRRA